MISIVEWSPFIPSSSTCWCPFHVSHISSFCISSAARCVTEAIDQPKTQLTELEERKARRIGLTAHILLQFLACFKPKWLLSPYRLPSGAVAKPSDVNANQSFSLPSFADIHVPDAKKGEDKNGLKQVKVLVDSLKSSNHGLWQVDERTLVNDAWDLER